MKDNLTILQGHCWLQVMLPGSWIKIKTLVWKEKFELWILLFENIWVKWFPAFEWEAKNVGCVCHCNLVRALSANSLHFLHFVKVDINGQKWSNIWVSFPTQELQHKICLVVRFVKHTDTGEDRCLLPYIYIKKKRFSVLNRTVVICCTTLVSSG